MDTEEAILFGINRLKCLKQDRRMRPEVSDCLQFLLIAVKSSIFLSIRDYRTKI